jgi:hypothetical protein
LPGKGTAGANQFETGVAREEGSTPYAVGRTSEFQRAGLASVNMAASRAEAAMDVSGSGSSELSRRSAAATVRGTSRSVDSGRPLLTELELEPTGVASDQFLLQRVQQALGSPAPGEPSGEPLSIQTLSNLRIDARSGRVTLRGRVASPEQSQQIEALVRGVRGAREVVNDLRIGDSPATPAPY